ncbi:unnamed protein product [Rotaria sp. Silwood1]|nr:unnamed protein product [Rotaria sp. Silwood1]CAF1629098.1 unnamed protein product [Rotaria sp. Silwood1]CAF3745471.1 unnamed protein product [Rotaria sp. Silwood1]CAF3806860.1 unnamed protein product [Rotaria sp. Silwood1]CAF3818625.1 unnamed protein product [Rotaria sp. Silwood1]
MPCEIINGYAKGFGLENSIDIPTETNHAWNAVEIDSHWYLIDSTCGTDHVDETKQFKHELTSFYFFSTSKSNDLSSFT